MIALFYFFKVIMVEQFFTCPYCWESVSVLLDNSLSKQEYIEDCEVCCNPIQFSVQFQFSEIIDFQVNSIEQ